MLDNIWFHYPLSPWGRGEGEGEKEEQKGKKEKGK
jgi:hypothetical protein